MVQGNFHAAIGPKSVRLSRGQFRFVVEALDDSGRNLPARPEPVQEQWPMTAQHARDLLHRLDAGAHDLDTPFVEERPRPIDRAVGPERIKALAQTTWRAPRADCAAPTHAA